MTLLLCSHMLHEVEHICSHVAILHRGRKLCDGPIGDIQGDARRISIDADRPSEAASFLVSRGLGAPTPDGLFLLHAGREPADVAAALVAGGFRLQGLAREKASLESFYMTLTASQAKGPTGGGA